MDISSQRKKYLLRCINTLNIITREFQRTLEMSFANVGMKLALQSFRHRTGLWAVVIITQSSSLLYVHS